MADTPTLTTGSGAPVADNQNSQTAGAGGPTLLRDDIIGRSIEHFRRGGLVPSPSRPPAP